MTNSAKHSGVPRISVFAERRKGAVDVFVRDDGRGFDLDGVAGDRRGIVESIVGRMQRAGGSATVHSVIDGGTEIELTLPVETMVGP